MEYWRRRENERERETERDREREKERNHMKEEKTNLFIMKQRAQCSGRWNLW